MRVIPERIAQSGLTNRPWVWNENGEDQDFRIETDTNENAFRVDAGLFGGVGAIGFGAAAANRACVLIDPPALTAVAATDTARLHIDNSAAITIPAGTTAIVAGLRIDEPNITATGTVTNAVTCYIEGAPTEGTNNYALWVDAGNVRLDGDLIFPGTTGTHDITLTDNVANALDVEISGGAVLLTFVTTDSAEAVVVNEGGSADVDFRVETDTVESALLVDAGNERVEIGCALSFTGDISPTALSGNVNDYNPTGLATSSVLRINPNGAARTITGLAGGADGRVIIICNISTTATETLTLAHEDAGSAAANRFISTDGTDTGNCVIQPGGAVMCCYDSTSSRWRVLVAK